VRPAASSRTGRRDLSGTQECRKPGRRKKSGKHGGDAEVEEKGRMPRRRIEQKGTEGTKEKECQESRERKAQCIPRHRVTAFRGPFPPPLWLFRLLAFVVFVLFYFIPSPSSLPF
jgi:hypothetical protein